MGGPYATKQIENMVFAFSDLKMALLVTKSGPHRPQPCQHEPTFGVSGAILEPKKKQQKRKTQATSIAVFLLFCVLFF